jgi:S1-C subfamily serine protease
MRAKISIGFLLVLFLIGLWNNGFAAEIAARIPKALMSGVGPGLQLNKSSAERLSSVLQELKKNLILENTRGEKDIELFRKNAPGVVLVFTNDSLGSGAVIDASGHIITNAHVVGANREVLVAFKPKDGSELSKDLAYRAVVEKIDELSDLALLRINTPRTSLTILKLGNVSNLSVGQDVHAIGHPKGEMWTYTKGIISQIRDNYEWRGEDGINHKAKVIQTQTPINPGNSGGPLLDDGGRLVGINSFGLGGSEGLNYALAVDEIQKFLQRTESRRAQRQQTASVAQPGFNCPEAYDTKAQRWSDILGCYNNRNSPPPNAWIVFGAPKSVKYMASNSFPAGMIDTVITNVDPNWQNLIYAFDSNCDGVIDLVGQSHGGKIDPDSYRSPAKSLRLVSVTTELDSALKSGRIPYPQLRVCQ